MKKVKILLTVSFVLIGFFSQAQEGPCGFDHLEIWDNPEFQNALALYDEDYYNWMQNIPHQGVYEIPVVFHIIHNNGPDNISDDQIINAIHQANEQFAGLEGGFDSRITLKLAKIDPDGNCTTGINRIQNDTAGGSLAFIDDNIKPLIKWDQSRYYNVWVVSFFSQGDGYSSTPPFDPNTNWMEDDGVVIEHTSLGYTETAVLNGDHNALAHETGHYLGLYHSFHGKTRCGDACHDDEIVDGISNCLRFGDKVCDTNQAFGVPDTDCTLNTTVCSGCPIDLEKPYPKDNYMGYNFPCQDKFTEGQAERMWFVLNQYRSELWSYDNRVCAGAAGYFGDDIVISENTSWTTSNLPNNGEITITGDLTINSGASLTINSGVIVHFCGNGKTVIKQNGRLNLYGTMTNSCGTPWQGIEVWGDNDKSQYATGGVYAHGDFRGGDGAIIENADIALQLWGPDYWSDAGGRARGTNMTFRNNRIAVQYAPYINYSPWNTQPRNYSSSFSQCNFETNEDFSQEAAFSAFIDMNGVLGVSFSGTSFINTYTPENVSSFVDYGYGIRAIDAGFYLNSRCIGAPMYPDEPCDDYVYNEFSGLAYGVYVANTIGNRPFRVKASNFRNCYFGIYNNGMSLGTYLFNDFLMGQVPNASLAVNNRQVGIMIENPISGMTFQENDLTASNTAFIDFIGVVAKNTGEFNNLIRKNRFVRITISNLANGDNGNPSSTIPRGLVYLCNENDDTDKYDFAIASTPDPGRINRHQGEYNDDDPDNVFYLAAGNLFSYNGNTAGDFYNGGGFPITYHYVDLPRQRPLAFLGIEPELSEKNNCATEYCESRYGCLSVVSDRDDLKKNFLSHQQSYHDLLGSNNLWELTPKEGDLLGYHQYKMDRYAEDALMLLAVDSLTFDREEYIWWISQINSYGSDLWLVKEYGERDMWDEAFTLINQLSEKWKLSGQELTDHGNMKYILLIIKDGGSGGRNAVNTDALKEIAQYDYGFAPAWAKAVLSGQGLHFEPAYVLPSGDSENRKAGTVLQEDLMVHITPNPTSDEYTISFEKDKNVTYKLVVFDMLGNLTYSLNELEGGDSISTSRWTDGMYLLQISGNGGYKSVTKLVIQH